MNYIVFMHIMGLDFLEEMIDVTIWTQLQMIENVNLDEQVLTKRYFTVICCWKILWMLIFRCLIGISKISLRALRSWDILNLSLEKKILIWFQNKVEVLKTLSTSSFKQI